MRLSGTLESGLADLQQQLEQLRVQRDQFQLAAAEASAALAGLEERRRNAASNFDQTTGCTTVRISVFSSSISSLRGGCGEDAARGGDGYIGRPTYGAGGAACDCGGSGRTPYG